MTMKSFLENLIKSYPPRGAAKSNPYAVHLTILSFIKVVSILKLENLVLFSKKCRKKYNDFRKKNMKNT